MLLVRFIKPPFLLLFEFVSSSMLSCCGSGSDGDGDGDGDGDDGSSWFSRV